MWQTFMNPEEARKLLAGSFGDQLIRFPLRFCKPVFFGARPKSGAAVRVRNGTATLAVRGDVYFAITCQHVIAEYRRECEESPRIFINIGNCELDLLNSFIKESIDLDVAVIKLSLAQVKEITRGSQGIGESFFRITEDRPGLVVEKQVIAFAGFPGEYRRVENFDELNFGGYACGAASVTTSGENYLVCQFDRNGWIRQGFELEPSTIGGISGGPVLEIRESEAGVVSHTFAGIVAEYSEEFGLLRVTQARAIHDVLGW